MAGSDNDDSRPSPDHLLTLVQRDQKKKGRGHLKVFLGMVAGVGKTYAMLQRAHQLKSQGVDVVIGWVDTHGRRDTEQLVTGLEIIPRLEVPHKGMAISEMDLDAVLARRPKLVLVDELAHTNAPALRHEKRYLDVLELLKAGIDVFTAVNIQHLESRVDTVKEITGITVQETVPDSILDEADEVALIDLPPEDLLLRLKEGRIYGAERAEAAARGFFSRGNLTALRELALRAATDRVDRDLRDFKTLHGIDDAWKSSSRLMVAVFASPYSDSLIRWTRQLADTMRGTWIGVHVDTRQPLSPEERLLLEKNMDLVRQLGGEFISVQETNLVDGILRVARQQNVTQIIVGKTQRSIWWNIFSGGSIVHRLLRKSGDIDVYAVATDKGKPNEHKFIRRYSQRDLYPWGELGWVFAGILGSWFVAALLQPIVGYESVGTLFLMTVTLSGMVLSRASVFAIAVCLAFIYNFFFIPPLYDFSISKPQDALMLTMYFLAASAIGHLTTRLKHQNRLIRDREDKAIHLFRLAQAVSEAKDLDSVVAQGVEHIGQIFGAEVAVLFDSEENPITTHKFSSFSPGEKELAVARWTISNGTFAGKFTETLPSASAIYFPLKTRTSVLGAVGLRFAPEFRLDFDRRNFLYALVGQLTSGIERELLNATRKRLDVLEQAEKLYRSLFDSVSHELKTPLTTVQGAASALKARASEAIVQTLSTQIEDESARLLEVVDNMLDMTRIESGALKTSVQMVDVADILGPSLSKLKPDSECIQLDVEQNLPVIRCDPSLTVQSLVNILRNAISYSGKGSQIKVSIRRFGANQIEFQVMDNGPGLPKSDPNLVFNRFYRAHPERSGGVGLGLSIAKGFTEAQGGTILAENAPNGGAVFKLRLPSI